MGHDGYSKIEARGTRAFAGKGLWRQIVETPPRSNRLGFHIVDARDPSDANAIASSKGSASLRLQRPGEFPDRAVLNIEPVRFPLGLWIQDGLECLGHARHVNWLRLGLTRRFIRMCRPILLLRHDPERDVRRHRAAFLIGHAASLIVSKWYRCRRLISARCRLPGRIGISVPLYDFEHCINAGLKLGAAGDPACECAARGHDRLDRSP